MQMIIRKPKFTIPVPMNIHHKFYNKELGIFLSNIQLYAPALFVESL
jgi:hypothetical protein